MESPKLSLSKFEKIERPYPSLEDSYRTMKLIHVLSMLSIFGKVEIRKVVGSPGFECPNFEILINNQVFFTLDFYYYYVSGFFEHKDRYHLGTEFTGSTPFINLEQIIRLYIDLKNLLKDNTDFQISFYNKDNIFMTNHYMITIGEKRIHVEHRYICDIEKRLQRDCPYCLK